LDQSLVIDIFVVALIVVIAIPLIVLAAGALLGRGGSHAWRVRGPSDRSGEMPAQARTRPSAAGLARILVARAADTPSPASGPHAPTPSTSSPAKAATNDRAPADSLHPSASPGRPTLPPHGRPRTGSTIQAYARVDGNPGARGRAAHEALVDPATGLASGRVWDELLRREEHRLTRYGRPVTLMVAELDGLDSLAARLGPGTGDRVIPPLAAAMLAAMLRNARPTDVVARTGHGRFVVLLPETDEVAATNYVERIRSECDMWLEADGLAVRLAVGWAQPAAGEHLADALRLADDRMNADRRRPDFRPVPSSGDPASTTRSHLVRLGDQPEGSEILRDEERRR
jgi:diguanylate cyclase (GGDEF)-like protein